MTEVILEEAIKETFDRGMVHVTSVEALEPGIFKMEGFDSQKAFEVKIMVCFMVVR